MSFSKNIKILPKRSSKLRINSDVNTHIEFLYNSSSSESDNTNFNTILMETFMIIGKTFSRVNHLGIAAKEGYKVIIQPNEQYMIINLTDDSTLNIRITSENHIESHEILYDPFRFEHAEKATIDVKKFKNKNIYPIPNDYIDILAKWYSIKFSYRDPDFNLIFIKPGLGISFQTHQLRTEHWEILKGEPIIITGAKVTYNTPTGTKFDIPVGTLHTIINPNQEEDEWVVLKETFSGTFDEMDITRGFNPNKYQA